jgi:hypothetical protein
LKKEERERIRKRLKIPNPQPPPNEIDLAGSKGLREEFRLVDPLISLVYA